MSAKFPRGRGGGAGPFLARSLVRPKAVVLLLMIHCFVGILCLFLVLLCNTLCPFWFCNHLDDTREREFVA